MEDTQRAITTTRVVPDRGDTWLTLLPAPEGEQPIQALMKYSSEGVLRSVKAVVPLRPECDEVYALRGKLADGTWGKKWSISAAGYYRLNLTAGVSLTRPLTIMDEGGETKSNPHVLRRPNRKIISVTVRTVGVGCNAMGALVARDYTIIYDLQAYFLQDLMAKWMGKKDEPPKGWGRFLPSSGQPTDTEQVYDLPGEVRLAVDVNNATYARLIQEQLNREKFAVPNAITLCERNLLKKFLGAARVDPRNMAVAVVGWMRDDRDGIALAEEAAKADTGRIFIDSEEVEVERDTETVADKDEIDEALIGAEDEGESAAAEPEPEPPVAAGVEVSAANSEVAPAGPPPPDPRLADMRAAVRTLMGKLEIDEGRAALATINVAASDVAEIDDVDLLAKCVEVLRLARLEKWPPPPLPTSPETTPEAVEEPRPLSTFLPNPDLDDNLPF